MSPSPFPSNSPSPPPLSPPLSGAGAAYAYRLNDKTGTLIPFGQHASGPGLGPGQGQGTGQGQGYPHTTGPYTQAGPGTGLRGGTYRPRGDSEGGFTELNPHLRTSARARSNNTHNTNTNPPSHRSSSSSVNLRGGYSNAFDEGGQEVDLFTR